MNWRSIYDLNRCIDQNLQKFQSFDLIVTIPRSGNLAGALLALKSQKQLTDIHSFANSQITPGGQRLCGKNKKIINVLVIDDSVTSGRAMNNARQLLADSSFQISYGCVSSPKSGTVLK